MWIQKNDWYERNWWDNCEENNSSIRIDIILQEMQEYLKKQQNMPCLLISSHQFDYEKWQFHDEIEYHKYNRKIAMNLPCYDIQKDIAKNEENIEEMDMKEVE